MDKTTRQELDMVKELIEELENKEITKEDIDKIDSLLEELKTEESKKILKKKKKVFLRRIQRQINETFGYTLKFLREERNLSMKDLEQMTGISQSYISRLESGERRVPSITLMKKLSIALDVPIERLLKAANITPLAEHKIDEIPTVQEVLLGEYKIEGEYASKEAKEQLMNIFNFIIKSSFEGDNEIAETLQLIALIKQFKNSL